MENNIFSVNRLVKLFKRQIMLYKSSTYIAIGAISGALLIIFFLMAFGERNCTYESQAGLFFPVFFICGYIFASRSFNELNDYRTGYLYLTLPVSNVERLFVGWFNSSILYSIVGVIIFIIISTLANILAALTFSFEFTWFDYKFKVILISCAVYIVTQSIFILGGIYFKKQEFLKTLLAIIIFQIAMGFIIGILGWGIIADFQIQPMQFQEQDFSENFKDFVSDTFVQIIKILFWYGMIPFFLIVSYFKLKETEV